MHGSIRPVFISEPKSKLHAIADYIVQTQNTALRTLDRDGYDFDRHGRREGIYRFAGDITQEEEERIASDLKKLGCKYVSVNGSRFAFTGRLAIRIELDL